MSGNMCSDLVNTVHHTTYLEKVGDMYVAICPFHEERTPSFTISKDGERYYCFGCNAQGNIVDYIMKFRCFNVQEAVEHLIKFYQNKQTKGENNEV